MVYSTADVECPSSSRVGSQTCTSRAAQGSTSRQPPGVCSTARARALGRVGIGMSKCGALALTRTGLVLCAVLYAGNGIANGIVLKDRGGREGGGGGGGRAGRRGEEDGQADDQRGAGGDRGGSGTGGWVRGMKRGGLDADGSAFKYVTGHATYTAAQLDPSDQKVDVFYPLQVHPRNRSRCTLKPLHVADATNPETQQPKPDVLCPKPYTSYSCERHGKERGDCQQLNDSTA